MLLLIIQENILENVEEAAYLKDFDINDLTPLMISKHYYIKDYYVYRYGSYGSLPTLVRFGNQLGASSVRERSLLGVDNFFTGERNIEGARPISSF